MKLSDFANDTPLIAPSLLAADFAKLGEDCARAEQGGADLLHCDVMDGVFVPNISFGPGVTAAIRRSTKLLLDVHLMIEHPAQYAASFAKAGAEHITFHWESADDPMETIRAIRSFGCTVGVSLKPATPPDVLFPLLPELDLVLVMSVEPGFGGQKFMHDQMPKVAALREAIRKSGRPVHLEIDGGIDENTAPTAIEAGANLLVAGTAIFRHPAGIAEAIRRLRGGKKG